MATCDVCGNDYQNPLEITQGQRSGTFDSFECAVQAMAPTCAECGVRIIGHGVSQQDGMVYCCSHCAQRAA